MNKKYPLIVIFVIMFVFGTINTFAHSEEDFNEAERLVQSKISCSELNDEHDDESWRRKYDGL